MSLFGRLSCVVPLAPLVMLACGPISTRRATPAPYCATTDGPIGFYVAGGASYGGGEWWPAGDDGGESYGPYGDDSAPDDGSYGYDPPSDPGGDGTYDPPSGDTDTGDPGDEPSDPDPDPDPPSDDGSGDDTDWQALHPRTFGGGCYTCSIACTTIDGQTLVTTSSSAISPAAACRDAQGRLAGYATTSLGGSLAECSRPPPGLTPATPTVDPRAITR